MEGKTYPQSCKDTERISDTGSLISYNSMTPLLVPTAMTCWSGVTEAHTASSEPNRYSGLTESACFRPLLFTEHTTNCPSENRTNNSLSDKENSK